MISIPRVTGTPITSLGQCTVPIRVSDRTIYSTVYVTEKQLSFGCDIILGIYFIIRHQLRYNPDAKTVTFVQASAATSIIRATYKRLNLRHRKRVHFLLGTTHSPPEPDNPLVSSNEQDAFVIDEENNHPLFVFNSIDIPAFSEMFVRIKLPRYLIPSENPYFIQGHVDQSLTGIQVARTIAFIPKAYVLVRVTNITSRPILLRKNLRIARMNPAAAPSANDHKTNQSHPADTASASAQPEQSRDISSDDFKLDHDARHEIVAP